jgi:DNA-binding SARP family transcriptional activator/tetratricopeptide (TPR) repeat protein
VQVRVLGPVDASVHGTPQPVPGQRRKAILAALALSHGNVVGTDLLVHIVWGETAPANVDATLQNHISRLRRLLGDRSAILAGQREWQLDTREPTDAGVAERLIRQGTQASDARHRADKLQEAVGLWRGPTLADVSPTPWFDEHARRLDALRSQARHSLTDARLALGHHRYLIAELETLVLQEPYDEPAYGQLMQALYRSGRQADALAVYKRLSRTLGNDLGIAPAPELRELEAAILRQDPGLDLPVPGTIAVARRTPAQLPPTVAGFAGRRDELARLDQLVAGDTTGGVCAITGTAGVGKTTLAIHWSHRVAGRFPDGHLYVNLRGFDPVGAPLRPGDAVRLLLDGLGVAAARIPDDPDAQAGLYRSLLAGRRVLVVLDNARDTDQVRPLLPGSGTCQTVVTSRSPLAPLVAGYGATSVNLDLLGIEAARELLAQRLGQARTSVEAAARDEIIERCAGLPLALSIVAALAATGPRRPLAVLAGELRDTLGTLRGGDDATDLRSVFSLSYRMLSDGAARLFRLFGLHPGPNLTAPAAAALAGRPAGIAHDLLAELARANLTTEEPSGRYGLHDLLREYAKELAGRQESDDDRRAARQRMFEHYFRLARAAAHTLDPQNDPFGEPITETAGSSWLDAEYTVLAGLVAEAARTGFESWSWRLSWTLTVYLLRRGQYPALEAVQRIALTAAGRIRDEEGQARTLHGLAQAYARAGRFDEAGPVLSEALSLFERTGDAYGQARVCSSLAWLAEVRGDPAAGLEHALQGLELARAAGHEAAEAGALNDAGWCLALLGDFGPAADRCHQALALNRRVGYREGEAAALDSLAYIHHRLGELPQATARHQEALDIARDLGDRYNEAQTLTGLGDVHADAGDAAAARAARELALEILVELDHPEADEVRRVLDESLVAPWPGPA